MNLVFKKFFHARLILMFLFGISSGLPLLLTETTLKARLKDAGVDITLIGIFSLVGLPYTLKFLWAPAVDRFVPPFLGRRRGWLFLTQMALVMSIIILGMSSPHGSLY